MHGQVIITAWTMGWSKASLKVLLFPVQRVAIIVASRAAALLLLLLLFVW